MDAIEYFSSHMQALKKLIPYIVILIATLPLYHINVHPGHNWGDDFAQYIMQASNIATGNAHYKTGYIFNSLNPQYAPPQYPLGFPLLLAPIVKIWGALSFTKMLQFIGLCLAALGCILFYYYRKYMGTLSAICLALLCVYASGIIELKNSVLSDIPCWVFIALYLALRNSEYISNRRLALLIATMTMAILIRSQSLVLLAAEGMYLLGYTLQQTIATRRLNVKAIFTSVSFKTICGAIVLQLLIDKLIFGTPGGTVGFYQHMLSRNQGIELSTQVGGNLNYLLDLVFRYFDYYPSSELNRVTMRIVVSGIFGLSTAGFFITVRKKMRVDDWYFILIVILIAFVGERQGVRFIISIIPIYLFYAFVAFRKATGPMNKWAATIVPLIIALVFLNLSADNMNRVKEAPTDNIPGVEDQKAFDYIRSNVGADELIIFAKPRALALFTNKKSMTYAWNNSWEENKAQFDAHNAKYILLKQSLNDISLQEYLYGAAHPIDSLRIAQDYMLYTLK